MKKDTITMSIKELRRAHIIKKAEEKLLTQKGAAKTLNLSERQFRRIISRFREEGTARLIHKLRDNPSHRKFKPAFSSNIANIYKKEFLEDKPTFFP